MFVPVFFRQSVQSRYISGLHTKSACLLGGLWSPTNVLGAWLCLQLVMLHACMFKTASGQDCVKVLAVLYFPNLLNQRHCNVLSAILIVHVSPIFNGMLDPTYKVQTFCYDDCVSDCSGGAGTFDRIFPANLRPIFSLVVLTLLVSCTRSLMDKWASSTQAEPVVKKAKGKDKLEGKTGKLLLMACKLSLNNAQNIRSIMATVFLTFILSSNSPVVAAGMEAGKEFAEKTKCKKGHNLGQPNYYVWAAISGALCSLEGESASKALLVRHRSEVSEIGMLKDIILHCRISRCYDNSQKRLTLSFHPSQAELEKATVSLLQLAGAEMKEGQAAPGNLERQIQELLDDFDES